MRKLTTQFTLEMFDMYRKNSRVSAKGSETQMEREERSSSFRLFTFELDSVFCEY